MSHADKLDISVVIPAFNESRAIKSAIYSAVSCLEKKGLRFEIIVSDDGSKDDTVPVVEGLAGSAPHINILKGEHKGKGAAVKAGVLASRGELVLFSDADMSCPIEEIEKLLPAIRGGADIAIASRGLPDSRIVKHQPRYREFFGKALNKLIQFLYLPGISDTQCGFKLFKGEAARELFALQKIDGFLFDAEILLLARKKGYKVKEVPVAWEHKEKSKVSILRHLLEVVADLLRLKAISRTT